MSNLHYRANVLVRAIEASTSLTDLVYVSARIDDAQHMGDISSDTARLLRLAMHERADRMGRDGIEEFRHTTIGEVTA